MTETTKTLRETNVLHKALVQNHAVTINLPFVGESTFTVPARQIPAIEYELTAPYLAEIARLTARVAAADKAIKAANLVVSLGCALDEWKRSEWYKRFWEMQSAVKDYKATATTTAPEGNNNECVCGPHEHQTVGKDVDGAHDRGHERGTTRDGESDRVEADMVPERGTVEGTLRPRGEQAEVGSREWGDRSGPQADGSRVGSEASSVDTTTAPDPSAPDDVNSNYGESATITPTPPAPSAHEPSIEHAPYRRLDRLDAQVRELTTRLDEQATCISRLQASVSSLHDTEKELRKRTRDAGGVLEQNKVVFEKWSEQVNDSIEKIVKKVDGFDNAFDGLLIGLGVDISQYGDPPTMDKEQIIAALEAPRTPAVDDPEYDDPDTPVVTKRMAGAAFRAYTASQGETHERGRWTLAVQAAIAAGEGVK